MTRDMVSFFIDGADSFICHVNGNFTISALQEIENDAREFHDEAFRDVPDGAIVASFFVSSHDAERGEKGAVNVPGYFNLQYSGEYEMEQGAGTILGQPTAYLNASEAAADEVPF